MKKLLLLSFLMSTCFYCTKNSPVSNEKFVSINGVILESNTSSLKPVENAFVQIGYYTDTTGIVGTKECYSDNNGQFSFNDIIRGAYSIKITKSSYDTLYSTVQINNDTTMNFYLAKKTTKQWQSITSPTDKNLCDIYFSDTSNGWIIGENVILKTIDCGINWHIVQEFSFDFHRIQFIDNSVGWISITEGEHLLFTDNCGDAWTLQDLPETGDDFFFVNSNDGWFVSDNAIYKTSDGGNNWVKQYENPKDDGGNYSIGDLYFIDELKGWVGYSVYWFVEEYSGVLALFYYTEDGGNNWETLSVTHNHWINSFQFCDELFGYFAGSWLFKTMDGGLDWNHTNLSDPKDFFFTNSLEGWAIKENDNPNDIYFTKDGGNHWDTCDLDFPVTSLFFLDADNGWAVGENGLILRYGY